MAASVREYKRVRAGVRARVLPVCGGVETALRDPAVNAMSQKELPNASCRRLRQFGG